MHEERQISACPMDKSYRSTFKILAGRQLQIGLRTLTHPPVDSLDHQLVNLSTQNRVIGYDISKREWQRNSPLTDGDCWKNKVHKVCGRRAHAPSRATWTLCFVPVMLRTLEPSWFPWLPLVRLVQSHWDSLIVTRTHSSRLVPPVLVPLVAVGSSGPIPLG